MLKLITKTLGGLVGGSAVGAGVSTVVTPDGTADGLYTAIMGLVGAILLLIHELRKRGKLKWHHDY